jgi:predicted component of type VI protein secretion system
MTDTLKSICGQCPHLNNPQLDFIPEDLRRLKEIILRDLKELVSTASSELT